MSLAVLKVRAIYRGFMDTLKSDKFLQPDSSLRWLFSHYPVNFRSTSARSGIRDVPDHVLVPLGTNGSSFLCRQSKTTQR